MSKHGNHGVGPPAAESELRSCHRVVGLRGVLRKHPQARAGQLPPGAGAKSYWAAVLVGTSQETETPW